MRTSGAGRINKASAAIASLIAVALALAACSGGSLNGFFSGSGGSGGKVAPVSFAPTIIGPPKEVASQLSEQLVAAARQKNIPVVTEQGKSAAYTVQGYLAQSSESKTEKYSYILDVTDQSGKRVHRILGEEAVPAKPGAAPWASINQSAMQKIAVKTADDLAQWLPKQSTGGGAAAAVASSEQERSSPPQRKASSSGKIAALVPPVQGAPGDGRTSLTKAIRERLTARGVHVASTGGNDVYQISGKVSVGDGPDGKQRVRIEWKVYSPSGQDLGTVTQQSDVSKGSLERWGPAATAAGNAAASEIVKLIRKSRA